ncbi:MAG: SMP-30/gluconolactonase/LRE family protein [bacterium]|nr:SMP-30/gluconolactonase/LRE family protein [bacterium]
MKLADDRPYDPHAMPPATELETLVTGRGLLEGPCVDSKDRLYFSDTQNGGVFRRDLDGSLETVIPKRKGVGGIALHADGGLVVTGRDVSHVVEGESRIVFGPPDIPGFNDLFTDPKGCILVGSLRSHGISGNQPQQTGELYRIDRTGSVTLLCDDLAMANGIASSPDARKLYTSDSARNQVLVHDASEDGRLTHRRVFAQAPRGVPDGLAVDEEGFVWIAAYGGGCVTRFTPEGRLDRHLAVPAKIVTSLCFGGSDRRDLYITTADNTRKPALAGCIFRTRVEVSGVRTELARI